MSGREGGREGGRERGRVNKCVCEREREREARGEFEGSEEISMNILHVLPATRESSRKILIEEIFPKKGGDWYAKNKRTFAEQHTVDAF